MAVGPHLGGQTVVLEAGEALWLPATWAHEVTGESRCGGSGADPADFIFSLNRFYRTPLCRLLLSGGGGCGLGFWPWFAVMRLRLYDYAADHCQCCQQRGDAGGDDNITALVAQQTTISSLDGGNLGAT